MTIPNVRLPHNQKAQEKEEPFVSIEQEMAKRQAHMHPEAAEGRFTPAEASTTFKPAHDIANIELEKPDDDEKDAD